MTIAKTDARKQYAGDDSTTPFSFPYRFFADSDLQVYLLVDATGVETLQTLTTHYTVSNNGDETGGTVTMVTAPATGETLTILRAVPQTQGTDYAANDPFPAETHEAALDRLTLLAQQLQEELGRALIAPASDSASVELPIDRASSFLAFDASKNPIASAGGVSDVVVSTFMATVLDDLSALAAQATLLLVGQQTIGMPAGSMNPTTTNGAAAATAELATNDVPKNYLAFDDSTEEYAGFDVPMPKGWNEGTFVAQFYWYSDAATTGDCIWGIQAVAIGDNDAQDAAYGTAVEVTDTTNATAKDNNTSSETSAMTAAGTPAAEDLVQFKVYRKAADGSDTLVGDALLTAVRIHYTTDAATDD